jgi:hypothetical protein
MFYDDNTMDVEFTDGKTERRKIDRVERGVARSNFPVAIPVLKEGEEAFWRISSSVPIIIKVS